jgi:hypothetical protein
LGGDAVGVFAYPESIKVKQKSTLFRTRQSEMTISSTHNRPKSGVYSASAILQAAIIENSNYALDWMWYTEQVENDDERRYCFERALYIDPHNQDVLDALAALNRRQAKPVNHTEAAPLSWLHRARVRFSL